MTIQAEPTRSRRRADEQQPTKSTATKTENATKRATGRTATKQAAGKIGTKQAAGRSATRSAAGKTAAPRKAAAERAASGRRAAATTPRKGVAASVATKVAKAAKAATASVEAPPRPTRSRSAAAQRAYARRAHREGRKVERVVEADNTVDRAAGRASFVVLIIAVLTIGVAATLWLSTQAIADSYRLDEAKKEAEQLSEQAAQLQREVTEQESAASLAERAKAMGMVPAGDPARLVVQPDGTVVLVGEPTPVQAPPPSTPPAGQNQTQANQEQTQPPDGAASGAGG